MEGRITKQISNQYQVTKDEKNYVCSARGKFRNLGLSPLVGDNVLFDAETLTIEEILPRKNELDRPVVANIDVALIVTSVKKPDLSLSLLDKELSVIIKNNVEPVICLTKLDLLEKKELKELKPLIKYYKSIGIKVVDNKNLGKIKKILKNKLVVLTGQTGAGKSSLLNKLDKKLNLETKPISEALNRGVHTTRHTEIYKIGKIYFVDTPGFSALDLKNINKEASRLSRKVLVSAVANAENNLGLNKKDLVVKEAIVNEGQTMKRMKFGSRGHVDPIKKRTSHIKIVVSDNK